MSYSSNHQWESVVAFQRQATLSTAFKGESLIRPTNLDPKAS